MMRCNQIDEKLSAYLDGEITSEDGRLVEEHLAICQECRLKVSDLTKTRELVQGLDRIDPPSWLAQKVMAHVREEAESRKGVFQRLFYPFHIKIPIEVAATCLIAVLSFYIYKATGPEIGRLHEPQEQRPVVAPEQSSGRSEKKGRPLLMTRQEEKGLKAGSDTYLRPEKKRKEASPDIDAPRGSAKDKEATPSREEESVPSGFSKQPAMKKDSEVSRESVRHGHGKATTGPPGASQSLPAAPSTETAHTKELNDGTQQRQSRPERKPSNLGSVWPQQEIVIRVHAEDMVTAAKEAERLLNQAGVQAVTVRSREDSVVLTARLEIPKIATVLDKLKSMGRIETRGVPAGLSQENAVLRIEIMEN
jgi:anti-sigma factor RsiW